MMDYVTLQNIIVTIITIIVSTIAILKKNGYWDKIASKLRIPSSIATMVEEQDDEIVIAKLAIPDGVLGLLDALVLQDQERLNSLRKIDRPLTEPEKDEFIQIVKRVMCAYRY